MTDKAGVVSLDDYRTHPAVADFEAAFLVDEGWSDADLRLAWNAFVRQWLEAGLEPDDEMFPVQVRQVGPGWHVEVYTMRYVEPED